MILIDGVSPTTRKPGAYLAIETTGARTGLPAVADKVLVIGHRLTGGLSSSGVPVQVYSEADARAQAGAGTPAALAVKALLEQNPYVAEIWMCLVNEAGGGAAATGSALVALSSLTAGTLYLKIGRHVLTIGLAGDEADTDVAQAIVDAITAASWLPFSAARSTATANLTCKTKGLAGNDWLFAYEYSGSGLTLTLTQPTGGATDGAIATLLTAVYAEQFDIIVSELNEPASADAIITHLDALMGPMEQRPGLGLCGYKGSLAQATTFSAARNSGIFGVPYMRMTRTHPIEVAAAVAGAFVSEPDRARPLNGLVLKPVVPPDSIADRLSRAEIESALANGLMPLEVRGSDVCLVRSVSTYVEDANGDADDTLLDLQTMRVLFYFQYALKLKFQQELARVKLAALAQTPNTTDPDKMKSLAVGVAMQLQTELGYLQGVEDDLDRFIFEIDSIVSGRVNAQIPARIVPGLHVVAGSIQLIL